VSLVATVGTGTVIANNATGATTVSTAVGVGKTLLGAIAWENAATVVPTVNSISDSRGNSYTFDIGAGTDSTVAVGIFRSAPLTTALQISDTISIVLSATRSRWCMAWFAFDDILTQPAPPDQTGKEDNPSNFFNLSPYGGATPSLTVPYQLVFAVEGFPAPRGPTVNAPWTGLTLVETAAGSANRACQPFYQYVNSVNPVDTTGAVSLSTNGTYAGALATYPAGVLFPKVNTVKQAVKRASFY